MNKLHEQIDGYVRLDGTRGRLPILGAWKLSSSVYWVEPDYPAVAINFKIGKPDKSAYAVTLAMESHPTRGLWRVYVPGRYFPRRAETYYKIVALDENNARHVCGEGLLRIESGAVYDADDTPMTEADCYVSFPDSLWRKVTVFTDTTGERAFAVDQTGVEASSFDTEPANPFAFNAQTGAYHAVTGFVDSVGEAFVKIAANGVIYADTAFARDPSTGFYYRVQTAEDTAGDMAPIVGDRK